MIRSLDKQYRYGLKGRVQTRGAGIKDPVEFNLDAEPCAQLVAASVDRSVFPDLERSDRKKCRTLADQRPLYGEFAIAVRRSQCRSAGQRVGQIFTVVENMTLEASARCFWGFEIAENKEIWLRKYFQL